MSLNSQLNGKGTQVNVRDLLAQSKVVKIKTKGLEPLYGGGERLTKSEREALKPLIRETVIHTLMLLHQGNNFEGVDVYQVADEFHCKPGFVRNLFNLMIQKGEIVQLSGKSGSSRVKYHLSSMEREPVFGKKFINQEDLARKLPQPSQPKLTDIQEGLTKETIFLLINELEQREEVISAEIAERQKKLHDHSVSIETLKAMIKDF